VFSSTSQAHTNRCSREARLCEATVPHAFNQPTAVLGAQGASGNILREFSMHILEPFVIMHITLEIAAANCRTRSS